jgi:YVTN family beta-propeller protein
MRAWWLAFVLGLAAGCDCGDEPRPEPDAAVDAGDGSVREDGGVDAGDARPPYYSDEFPEPAIGHCETVAPPAEALWTTGATPEGALPAGFILPGGRRVTPAGVTRILGGFPTDFVELAGDRVLVTDSWRVEHRLHLVDATTGDLLDSVGEVDGVEALFRGIVVSPDGASGFAAGGGGSGFGIDLPGQQGGQDDSADPLYPFRIEDDQIVLGEPIRFPAGGYPSGLALTADGSTLFVALELGDALALLDTDTGEETARLDLGDGTNPYAVVLSADESRAYVSLWADSAVAIVDLDDPDAPELAGTIATGKNPEGMLVTPDGARLLVVNADSDTMSVIDLSREDVVETVRLGQVDAPFGAAPNNLALSPDGTRLYCTLSGLNAVEVLDADTFETIGSIPTAWYPTAVAARDDGAVLVLTSKGVGSGPAFDVENPVESMAGSISIVPPLTDDDLADGAAAVEANVTRLRDVHQVDCAGGEWDFPVPLEPGQESPIKRVVLVVRENKTYDSQLGALEGANGDPDLVVWREDETTPNFHALARAFVNADNFYSQAEMSVQGHLWTTTVATTDFAEKTGLLRNRGIPLVGLEPIGTPERGFFFEMLLDEGVETVSYGEMMARTFRTFGVHDSNMPGAGLWNLHVADRERVLYIAERALWDGFLPAFTYISLHRNHTAGDRAGYETPQSMVADNDEATGMLVETISHSVFWPETAIFIIEDDPQDHYDHVDGHRSTCVVVSPWAKRGALTSVHYDNSSVYRTIEMILGLSPMSRWDQDAAPMLDAFTSSPDYTPFEHLPRTWPVDWNPDPDADAARRGEGGPAAHSGPRRHLDLSLPDQTGGLGPLLWRMVRGGEPPAYAKIIPGTWEDADDE